MTTPPAAWYDDPQDASGLRFWDGANWTVHRLPKDLSAPAEPEPEGSVWRMFPDTFDTIGAVWRQLIIVTIPNVVMAIVAMIVTYATINAVYDGELGEMIRRLNDGTRSAADDVYFDTLDPGSPGAMLAIAIIVGLLWFAVGSVVATAIQRTFAASLRGGVLEPAEAFQDAMARVGRVLLWSVPLAIVLALGFFMVILLGPLGLLVITLISFPVWPYLAAFQPALAIAPEGTNPFTQTHRALKGRFWRSVLRCLVFALLWFVINFSAALVGTFFAFDLRVAFVGLTLSTLTVNVVLLGGLTSYWIRSGGEIDPDLAPVDDASF